METRNAVFVGNCYIFDLDGTLFDCGHRQHHLEQEPKNWDAFFADTRDDTPIPHMVRLVRDLRLARADILYVTGRPEKCRPDTVWQFDQHGLPSGGLYMRADNDFRGDDVLKVEQMISIRDKLGYHPIAVFEDRKRVVIALREAGFRVMHVAEGDF